MTEINRRGLMFILSAPSGTGKTTLANLLFEADQHMHRSISVTTRQKRPGEQDGLDYYFTDQETFKKMVASNEFLEYAKIFGASYGTPRSAVEDYLKRGEDVLFEIDWQGHRALMATARDDVASIFILPPTKQDLLVRLQNRQQDSSETMQYRMEQANLEISHWHEYDYTIINKDIDDSLSKLLAILRAERLKKSRRLGLSVFVGNLLKQDFHRS